MGDRNNAIDVLKGMLLVIITINHIGGPLCLLTFQPLGFVSSAEGFVFLSGFIFGLVNWRKSQNGNRPAFSVTAKRVVKIYTYHIVLLLILLISAVTNYSTLATWRFPELDNIVIHPGKFAIEYLLLLNRPFHLDILPMYIVFMPMGFLVVKAFIDHRQVLAMVISVTLWGLTQFDQVALWIPAEIRSDLGHFNFFSWQILFFAGCFCGYYRSQVNGAIARFRWLPYVAVILFCCLAYLRYFGSDYPNIFIVIEHLTTRPNLGILRLLSFSVTAYLISQIIKAGYFPRSGKLALLGRYSLQVFAFQIVLVYAYLPFVPRVHSMHVLLRIVPQLGAVLLLFVPALIKRNISEKALKDRNVFPENLECNYIFQK
jgi:hypothetical protein